MKCQCWFTNCSKCTALVQDVDGGGNCVCRATRSIRELSVLSAQFCCEPKSSQKIKYLCVCVCVCVFKRLYTATKQDLSQECKVFNIRKSINVIYHIDKGQIPHANFNRHRKKHLTNPNPYRIKIFNKIKIGGNILNLIKASMETPQLTSYLMVKD